MQGNTMKDIGLLGMGPQVNNILNGIYRPPYGTKQVVKEFLKQMKLPQVIKLALLCHFKTSGKVGCGQKNAPAPQVYILDIIKLRCSTIA